MKATETKLLDFLNKPKQFVIPIYQRTYSWTQSQCEQLWKDIIRSAYSDERSSGHFVGSIVYIEKGLYHVSTVPQLLVIDGQQRLTTITLLLFALARASRKREEKGEVNPDKINYYYLMNREEEGELHFKLILTQSDKGTLIRLLQGKELPDNPSKRIIENFSFFEEKIASSKIDLNTLYQGILKLIVVDISLDREHDNPQRIFESLNSTGLELTQADLIRNYVLMGLEPKHQEELYQEYWFPMEQNFGQIEYVKLFDRYMRDYLTVQLGRIPNISDVYDAFKELTNQKKDASIQNIVADVYTFSKYFVNMALLKEPDKEIRFLFEDINSLKVDVAYPFLLEAYGDYAMHQLDREDFMEVLRLVENYVFRRAICGIPTNSLNKTFATLSKEIDKKKYLESLKAAFILKKDSYRRFPTDDEFIRELSQKDLYNFRNRNYWLRKLENFNTKEPINVENYTIEHILPQNENLSQEWREELGENWKEVQSKYLHTLGNLTLTGYNSEYSDRPFREKRDMKNGFKDSPIRLNKDLGKLEHWNENEILNRAKKLARIATQTWSYPDLDPETIARYQDAKTPSTEQVYSLEDFSYLQGPTKELFDNISKRILNLDSSVRMEIKKLYIAFKATTNFVDIIPQKNALVLMLNMKYSDIYDPKAIAKDVTNKGTWGNGDVEVKITSIAQIEEVMMLIQQSFDQNAD